ncbi:uncharacterized protein LOC129755579 [Uranotaenia lowii]|uniref:uncharacterized protein LOC129755579 n=1 Tax=Uranotaenia lowii TaxID=190385 RepID=UPI00247A7B6E|nr:uncharacterized protein LOC129755579 [Uranotaenia lowii]
MPPNVSQVMCRVCAQSSPSEDYVQLFQEDLAKKLRQCASVRISERDGLPAYVCTRCYYDIEVAFALRKRCEATDEKLRRQDEEDSDEATEEDPFAFEHIACDSTGYIEPESVGESPKKSSPSRKEAEVEPETVVRPKTQKERKKELLERVKRQGLLKVPTDSKFMSTKNEISRETFYNNEDFREKVLIPVLDKGLIPKTQDLQYLTRVACQYMERRILKHYIYPSTDEVEMAAKKILSIFPHLSETRVSPEAPPESRFFWRNTGVKGGPHSGTVYHRVRGLLKSLPPSARKFSVPPEKRHRNTGKRRKPTMKQEQEGHEMEMNTSEQNSDG